MDIQNALQKAEQVVEQVRHWRRYLHQHPELSFQEHQTAQYVYSVLEKMDAFELSRPTKTSVMARLKGAKPGKTVAMRADMDALPIQEQTGLPFASVNAGVMHACAHDGHTAMLLGAAKVLTDMRHELHGEIVLLFQHAEEVPPGGAQEMVAAGVLDGVDCVTGIHLMSTIPAGVIGIRTGALTSASDVFKITVQGKGGHASTPELTIDPLAAGAQMVTALNHIVSRSVAPLHSAVVSVTKFQGGGSALNVIPDTVSIGGSVRVLDGQTRELIKKRIHEIAEGIAKANGAEVAVDYTYGYNPVINDSKVTEKVRAVLKEHFTNQTLTELEPMMGGEDFSAFSDEKPGCFVMIGAGNKQKEMVYPHHHPKFDIDEDALKEGVKLHVLNALTLTV